MHVLLVEPEYYSKYPPLGLLKVSAYHRSRGDTTELVCGCVSPLRKPCRVYVTSLFTWTWKKVWEAVRHYKNLFPNAKLWLGGLYASLLPDHASLSGADHVFKGLFSKAENLMPDYSLVPRWNGSIVFASRGCVRACGFCSVPKLEGKLNSVKPTIRHLIYPKHRKIILWDNNILAAPNLRQVLDELRELGLKVDFNQGLDARLVTPDIAGEIANLKTDVIRIAYDRQEMENCVERAIKYFNTAGVRGRKIVCYVLYNYTDSPDDFFERIRNLMEWGVVSYPMRFEPLNSLKKNCHIGPKWTSEELEMVADARRVLGTHGAFPPYEGLRIKLKKAHDFLEAFSLRPPVKKMKKTPVIPRFPPLPDLHSEVVLPLCRREIGNT